MGIDTNLSRMLSQKFDISDVKQGSYINNASAQNAATVVNGQVSTSQWLGDAITRVGQGLINAFTLGGLGLITGKADGGMIGKGLFMGGENGREFVMNNQTTRAAESLLGGQLTQERLISALAGGKRISYHDSRRFDSSVSAADRRMIANETILAITGAL